MKQILLLHKKLQGKLKKGFTFIEILIFTTIISFLFISLTSTVISSLQRIQVVEHRLYASRYAEEMVEWLRAEKEADWQIFVNRALASGSSNTYYCFNNVLDFITPVWPGTGVDSCGYTGVNGPLPAVGTPPFIYRRYVLLAAVAPSYKQVNIQVVVEWRDGNRFYSVPLNTVFTDIDENVGP